MAFGGLEPALEALAPCGCAALDGSGAAEGAADPLDATFFLAAAVASAAFDAGFAAGAPLDLSLIHI